MTNHYDTEENDIGLFGLEGILTDGKGGDPDGDDQ